MHPIEHLRYIARSQGAASDALVEESSYALAAFEYDPAGMVAACRRMLARQVTCAPLWTLCARVLHASAPMEEADAVRAALHGDLTSRHLADALPEDATLVVVGWPEQSAGALRVRGDVQVLVVDTDGEAAEAARQLRSIDVDASAVPTRNVAAAVASADVVLIDALAAGPERLLAPAGSASAAALARRHGIGVWALVGSGRMLPVALFDALCARWSDDVDPLDSAEELLAMELVEHVLGPDGKDQATERQPDCPAAPELLRLNG